MGFKLCYALPQGIVSCKPAHETADNKKITVVKMKYGSVIGSGYGIKKNAVENLPAPSLFHPSSSVVLCCVESLA